MGAAMQRRALPIGRFAVAATSLWLIACATTPKPQELVALEQLRQGERFADAEKKQAQLIAESTQAHTKSIEAWEDDDLELAKHWATVGSIKLRTALALLDQTQAREQVAQATAQMKQLGDEQATLAQKIKEADEKIRLYEQLAMARSATKERELQLSEAQQKSEAQKKVANAQLALKMADSVDAATYAKATYALAQELVNKATAALKADAAAEATSSAGLAKSKADAAYQAARPRYLEARQTASRQAQNQALQKNAAAIDGVTVKLKTVGQAQQLVLPVTDLFKRRATTPRGDRITIINAIGALLKKYPSYPVIINGYTSYRVRKSQRYAVSQTRAQKIADHFVTMGLPLKRFAVSGRGTETLIARRYSSVNDRVEIILLFQ